LLTTQRRFENVHEGGRSSDDGDQRRRWLGRMADGVRAPGGIEDVNLRQEKLSKCQMEHQSERKGEKEESFTGDEFFTSSDGGTEAATRASVAALVG
jgi:hypothetical protein